MPPLPRDQAEMSGASTSTGISLMPLGRSSQTAAGARLVTKGTSPVAACWRATIGAGRRTVMRSQRRSGPRAAHRSVTGHRLDPAHIHEIAGGSAPLGAGRPSIGDTIMHPFARRCRRESAQRTNLAAARLSTLLVLLAVLPLPAAGQSLSEESVRGVVQVDAIIPSDARTAESLGTERVGTGVLIDDNGLVVTIGYLILEASEVTISGASRQPVPATILAYDHESGFGLIRASQPLDVAPVSLGNSTALRAMQPLLVVSHAGELDAAGVYLVDRREFAGYWEYLLEDALFTSPPHAKFGGAALIDQEGRLVGIGSLFVNDAGRDAGPHGRPVPGNMFVPIDGLKAIMGDLLSRGRRADPGRPWLGLTMEEHRGRVFVTRVSPDGPAEAAGIEPNDMNLGIDGVEVQGLGDLYRKLWSRGNAGVAVPLDVLQGIEVKPVTVESIDRDRYLRPHPTY